MRHDTAALSDFLIFTPFTASEVAAVLFVSPEDIRFAISDGTLKASVTGSDDPFSRLRAHSFWDILEFELFLRAGWPLCIEPDLRQHIDDTCDGLAIEIESGFFESDAYCKYDVDQRQACLPDYLDQIALSVMSKLLQDLGRLAGRLHY